MAATVDFGVVDPDKGVYGLYNDFLVILEHSGAAVFKLKYRVKVSDMFTGSAVEVYTFDVDPISNVGVCNPIEGLRDSLLRTQIVGSENGVSLDDTSTDDVADKAYRKIRIEVGEIYSSTATGVPSFQGYDTSTDIWVFNGYIPYVDQSISATDIDYENYRNNTWYQAQDNVALPIVNTTTYISPDFTDPLKLMFHSYLDMAAGPGPTSAGQYTPLYLTETYYDTDGNAGTPTQTDISALLSDDGYWCVFLLSSLDPSTYSKVEYFITYAFGGAEGVQIDSVTLTVLPDDCNKNDRYRIRYYNRFGAFEYFNFRGKSFKETRVQGGKNIVSTGVDYTTTTFANLKPKTSAEIIQYGQTAQETLTLYTDYIDGTQQEQIKDILKSRNTIVYEPNFGNTIRPIIPITNSVRIENIKDGLQQLSIQFRYAQEEPIQYR